MITDIVIDMKNYHFGFADILTASLNTSNGNPTDFSFTGVSFNLDAGSMGFSATDKANSLGYTGNFSVTQEMAGTVPEPATWAMLVLGFGGIGAMLRLARRQRHAPVTAA